MAQGLAPHGQKVKDVGNTLDSHGPGVTDWLVTTLRLVSHHWLCSLGASACADLRQSG